MDKNLKSGKNDLLVMDALGWQLSALGASEIPEPSTYGIWTGFLFLIVVGIRKKLKLILNRGV
jgi:hypothetical protein